jgi:hypothetical protein
MEEEAQGLQNELGRRRATAERTAFSQQQLKRINQETPPPRLRTLVRSEKAAHCVISLRLKRSVCRMHYSDYLREQAAKYRQLAETAEDAFVKQELLELAAVCEEVANEIDDQQTSG